MGDMPYPLEKGLFPLVIEHFFNEGLERSWACARPRWILHKRPGPKRRLRAIWRYCKIAETLRNAEGNEGTISAVTPDNSFIYSSIFTDSRSPGMPHLPQVLIGLQRTMAEGWFGMEPNAGGTWNRRPTSTWTSSKSLGRWIGYYGNAELILCETLQRMLEVSLGLEHQTTAPTNRREERAFERRLRRQATRVWPVCVFLTCPQPWFGGWITWKRHRARSAVRGQVTVLVQTPGHDRPITPSPVDHEADEPQARAEGTNIMLPNPYFLMGVTNGSKYNSGYDGKYIDQAHQVRGRDPRTAVNDQGMWIVTHENHDSAIVWSSFAEPPRPNWDPNGPDPAEAWDLPPIATYRCARLDQRADIPGSPAPDPARIDGFFDIVVVSPASRDGGIPSDPLFP
jgi:hypothetical protein